MRVPMGGCGCVYQWEGVDVCTNGRVWMCVWMGGCGCVYRWAHWYTHPHPPIGTPIHTLPLVHTSTPSHRYKRPHPLIGTHIHTLGCGRVYRWEGVDVCTDGRVWMCTDGRVWMCTDGRVWMCTKGGCGCVPREGVDVYQGRVWMCTKEGVDEYHLYSYLVKRSQGRKKVIGAPKNFRKR